VLLLRSVGTEVLPPIGEVLAVVVNTPESELTPATDDTLLDTRLIIDDARWLVGKPGEISEVSLLLDVVSVSLGLLLSGCKMDDRMQPKPLQPADVVEVAEVTLDGESVKVEGAICVGVALLVVVGVKGPSEIPNCEEESVELPLCVTGFVESDELPVRDESEEWRAGILLDVDESVVVDVSIELPVGVLETPVEGELRALVNDETMDEASPDSVLCRLERPPLNPGEEEVVDNVDRVVEESVVEEADVAAEEGEVLDESVVEREVETEEGEVLDESVVEREVETDCEATAESPVDVEDTEVETAGRRAVVPESLAEDESVEAAGTKSGSCGGLRSLFKDNDRRA
jgi:hypothetical protein